LAALLGATAGINFLVNPYGAWPSTVVDRIFLKVSIGSDRIATPYRLRIERPHTIIVGTSRMLEGMRIEQGMRDGVLNAALCGGSLDETAHVLQLALQNPALRRVVWGVDFTTFCSQLIGYRDRLTPLRFAADWALRVREGLLSFDTLAVSGRTMLRALGGETRLPRLRRAPIPWSEPLIQESLAALPRNDLAARERELEDHLEGWLAFYRWYEWSDRQLRLYADLIAQLRGRGLDTVVFLPPMSVYELELIHRAGAWDIFQSWKRQLANSGPYWDFSGYNAIATRDDLFTGHVIVHFQPAVGHTILRAVLGHACAGCGALAHEIIAAGVRVDATTVEAHLHQQDLARQQYAERHSIQSAAVERVRAAGR
jgi:hypothetical protein